MPEAVEDASAAVAVAAPKHATLSLEVLFVVTMAQNEHGLRHGDHDRYRQYCSRRIQRLRRGLNFHHGKRRFVKHELTPEDCTEVGYLHMALFEAERDWSYAMQLKDESDDEPAKRHHMLKRLKRAVERAAKLERLCADPLTNADKRTHLEAEAYRCWMKATHAIQTERWEDALGHFIRARTVYGELSLIGSPEHQDVYSKRALEIDPSIRFCQYSLQQLDGVPLDAAALERIAAKAALPGDDVLKANLDKAIGETLDRQTSTLDHVTYRGESIPLRNEKSRGAVLAAADAETSVDKARRDPSTTKFDDLLALYDKLLTDLSSAFQAIDGEISGSTGKSQVRSQKSEQQDRQMRSLREYVEFVKLSRTVERNTTLLEASERSLASTSGVANAWSGFFQNPPTQEAKVEHLVRLFDTLVDNMDQLIHLRSIGTPSAEDGEYLKEATAKLKSFKAMRCFYLCLSHAKESRYREAAALLDRAASELVEARAHIQECSRADENLQRRIAKVELQIRGERSRMNAARFARSVTVEVPEETPASTSATTVLENPQGFSLGVAGELHLAPFPPQFEALPCKPVLFDLASTYLTYPSLEDQQTKKAQAGGGFWGFWRR